MHPGSSLLHPGGISDTAQAGFYVRSIPFGDHPHAQHRENRGNLYTQVCWSAGQEMFYRTTPRLYRESQQRMYLEPEWIIHTYA